MGHGLIADEGDPCPVCGGAACTGFPDTKHDNSNPFLPGAVMAQEPDETVEGGTEDECPPDDEERATRGPKADRARRLAEDRAKRTGEDR